MFFLYHRKTRLTGTVLARALNLGSGDSGDAIPNGSWQAQDVVIRWGNRGHIYRTPGRVVNEARAIELASDKFKSLEVMRAAEVRVPNFSRNPEELTFPFLGRKTRHTQGKDVVLCLQKGDYIRKERDYFVQYIPTVREFRVHVAFGKVIRVQGKYLDRPEQAVAWIRNYEHGYRFRAPRKNLNQNRIDTAVNAVKSLGLDFGAVDLLIGDDGLEYVLEVNTAPSCSPLTARKYVEAFAAELNIPASSLNLNTLQTLSVDAEDISADNSEDEDDA